jgi:hypothetical protein
LWFAGKHNVAAFETIVAEIANRHDGRKNSSKFHQKFFRERTWQG